MEGEPAGGFAFVRPACDSVRRAGPLAHLSGYRNTGCHALHHPGPWYTKMISLYNVQREQNE